MAIIYRFTKTDRDFKVVTDAPSSDVLFFQVSEVRGLLSEDIQDGIDITEDENGVKGGVSEAELITKATNGSYTLSKYDDQNFIEDLVTP